MKEEKVPEDLEISIESKNSNNNNIEPVIKWLDDKAGDGENCILVYPNLQAFRQIYTIYVKDKLAAKVSNEQQSKSRIILIATYYETVDSVRHHLRAFGIKNVQWLVDEGSLVIVDALRSFFAYINGMKWLIDSLSHRARKEGRPGVTALVDVGSFFIFGGDGKAKELISYETSLAAKTQDSNVKGISCYHAGDYGILTYADKEEITQRQTKKLLEVREQS
jgi:hypothetical protein